jgi:uncharacterized delta-60 repeat protein
MRTQQRSTSARARVTSPASSFLSPSVRLYSITALLAAGLLIGSPFYFRASAAAGDLDPTFGNAGRVVTSFPGGLDSAEDVALQSNGKIVVGGSSGSDFALTRYNADGTLDATFGTGGRVNTDFPVGQGGTGNAMLIQPDDKIVVAGAANDPNSSFNSAFALVRYNADGSLDTSFDTDGRVVTSFPGSSASANAIARQPDGKLVVAGTSTDSSTFNSIFALARYNTDGSLDTSFDTDGRATVDFTELTFEEAHAVALQTDGKIVVVGLGSSAFAVARLNSNGSLDTSFDTDGKTMTAFGGTFEEADGVAIQSDGRVVVVGQTARSVASEDNFALARYNTDGSLDTSFDGDGKVTTDFGLVDAATAVVLQTDGKIVAAGRAGTIPMGSFFALARYNTNGSLDNSFDTDGKVLTDLSGGRFSLGALGVALQTDGRIVAAGDANISGQRDFGVVRYNTDGSLDTANFGTGGKVITDFPLNEDAVTALLIQPDSKIVAVGRAQLQVRIVGTQDPNFQLARYNADGSLDATFGTGGIVSTDFGVHGDDFANAAALQTDGKIVVVGQVGANFSQTPNADTTFGIARYNTNGSLDTSFGTGGLVTTDFGTTHDTARAVAIQTDGRIVVAGTNGSDFALARYNTNGSLDSGAAGDSTPADQFGTGGRVTTDFASTFDSASAVVIQASGKIVAAGSNSSDFALARYNTNGTLDTANFGAGGKVTTDFNGGNDGISELVSQSDGKLVAAGAATLPGTGSDFALARYSADGVLDTSGFGASGKVTTDFGGFDTAGGVALQTDGRIVAAGLYFPTSAATMPETAVPTVAGPAAFFALARYNTDGNLDSSFGVSGRVTTDFFGINNQAAAVVIQSDNKIVAGGFADTGSSNDFALARYQAAAPAAALTAQFSAATYTASEGDPSVSFTITLSAPAPTAVTVDYATNPDSATVGCDVANALASDRCDYTTTLGTARFAVGEQSKTVRIFLTDDAYVEGAETFGLTLSNPTNGLTLGSPSTALVTLTDNDTVAGANPIDNASFFVQHHYIDFLNRLGEASGVAAYVNQLNNCPSGAQTCDRVTTSASFFRSDEFLLKGLFVIRFYKVSLGANPQYREFTRDSQRVTGQTASEVTANRAAFAAEWVQRTDFRAGYDGLSNQGYVDKLEQTAGVTLANKAQLVNNLNMGTETRAQVLRDVVESNEVKAKMYNDAFVLMEYFGYLRRNPEPGGFNAWLSYLTAHPTDARTMVNGFVNSVEYRKRFGRP